MDINERLDFIEFRMDLLREGTELAGLLYDCNITKSQLSSMYDIMDAYRACIDNNEEVSSGRFETEILNVVNNRTLDYHFCESFAKLLWEDRRYEEVFETLYGDMPKFKSIINHRE